MALEPYGNGEICSVTGKEANAKFADGLGWAWYESKHDLSRFVDVSGRYEGPVADDVIDEALAKGEVFVYARAGSRLPVPAGNLPAEGAAIVFARGASRQRELLASPPDRTSVAVGMTTHVDASGYGAPRWLAPLSLVSGGDSDVRDFFGAGALWALGEAAAGRGFDEAAALEAGRGLHAFLLVVEDQDDRLDVGLKALVAEIEAEVAGAPAP